MNLYQLKSQYLKLKELMSNINDCDEESLSQLLMKFEIDIECIKDALDDKVINIALIYREQELAEEALEKEIIRLRKRKERLQHTQERMKDYIKYLMTENEGTRKVTNNIISVSLRKSIRTIITDERLIPDEYKHTEIITKIDKDKLKTALKSNTIDGAYLEERDNVNIK